MMNPNNVLFEVECQSLQTQMCLGLLSNTQEGKMEFSVMNIGAGSVQVSGAGENSAIRLNAIYHDVKNSLGLSEILSIMGCTFVSDVVECDYDLSPNRLQKDTIINLFS